MTTLFNLLQLIGGLILTIGYIPQIVKTFKTKSVKDFSIMYYLMIFTGVLCMELYAIFNVVVLNVAHMFLITNSFALACSGSMLTMTLLYKNRG